MNLLYRILRIVIELRIEVVRLTSEVRNLREELSPVPVRAAFTVGVPRDE